MKKPEKHNDFTIISETTETALTVDMKDELAKLLEGYARGGIPEKEERALIRDMYIGWAVRDILKKTLKELKRKSMLEDVLRERPRYAERLDEACNSRPIHNETVEEEPKPQIFCTDWLRAQPLLGELDFETDCHFPACRAKTKQVNHNFCRRHHRYFNRIQLSTADARWPRR